MLVPLNDPKLIGQATLMQMMFDGNDLSETASQLLNQSKHDTNNAESLLDLATILLLRGDRDVGLLMQQQALTIKQNFNLQDSGLFRLLILKAPGDFMANTPVEFLIDSKQIFADVLYVSPDLPYPTSIDYDLVFVAVSEAERNLSVLQMVEALLIQWAVPFINNPDEIPLLARDRACEIMDTIGGVYMPQTIQVSHDELSAIADLQLQLSEILIKDHFPVIARPVDSHAGQGLKKLSNHHEIHSYLGEQQEEKFYLSPFVDYSSQDGLFRKYRVVFVGGEAFLCHMAVSSNWMVHYLNADMTTNAAKQEEERLAMENFNTQLALRHFEAFDGIKDCIDLEYFGIDCAETQDGQLLIFEVANAMVVHDMDPEEIFPYKKPAMDKIFSAFQSLLYKSTGYYQNRYITNGMTKGG
ncbi:MAG: hypothetical protein KUG79_13295 [Pseudomonadales bacterium]|nr:hypothetical protein [Pseudomonadales bacterium]